MPPGPLQLLTLPTALSASLVTTNGPVRVTALDEVLPLGAVPLSLARPAVRAALTAQARLQAVETWSVAAQSRALSRALCVGDVLPGSATVDLAVVPTVPRTRRVDPGLTTGILDGGRGIVLPRQQLGWSGLRQDGGDECGESAAERPEGGPVNDACAFRRGSRRMTIALVVVLVVDARDSPWRRSSSPTARAGIARATIADAGRVEPARETPRPPTSRRSCGGRGTSSGEPASSSTSPRRWISTRCSTRVLQSAAVLADADAAAVVLFEEGERPVVKAMNLSAEEALPLLGSWHQEGKPRAMTVRYRSPG